MTDDDPSHAMPTRLTRLGRSRHGLINPPVARGSTVLFETMDALRQSGRRRYEHALSYGIHGNDTHFALADAVAAIEGGSNTQLVGSGLSAITTPLLGLLRSGDHIVVSDGIYGPSRRFCTGMLARFGVRTSVHPPAAPAGRIADLFEPDTRLVLLESPSSDTFEMLDLRAIADLAHARGILVALDNTWGFSLIRPFEHGVDLSLVALTKYASGHSDLLLGAVTVNDAALWRRVRDGTAELGDTAGPDDCWLALRGLRTLDVRLDRQGRSGLAVARFLAGHPKVARVLHPALEGAPGHAIWRRDYADGGCASLFSIEFADGIDAAAVDGFVDRLALFGKGWSWGGFESLALTVTGGIVRAHGVPVAGTLCRLHVGLEEPDDLIADLSRSLDLL